jgi:hypothetical protein
MIFNIKKLLIILNKINSNQKMYFININWSNLLSIFLNKFGIQMRNKNLLKLTKSYISKETLKKTNNNSFILYKILEIIKWIK